MNPKSIAQGIAATLDGDSVIADDDEVHFGQTDGRGPSDLLYLTDSVDRVLGKYRVVVEPVDYGVEMDFSAALHAAREGVRIARLGWNWKGMHVRLMTVWGLLPFLALLRAEYELVPWVPSQTDLLAEDWVRVVPVQAGQETA